jgi:hypothetical protein
MVRPPNPFFTPADVEVVGLDGKTLKIPLHTIIHVYALNALYTEVTRVRAGRAETILVLTPPDVKIPRGRAIRLGLEK